MAKAEFAVHGACDPRFSRVRDAFAENFLKRNELGAAVCVYKDGQKVVDLWAGHLDEERQRPWQQDSIVSMASVVKGMEAIGIAVLADRNLLDYDAPVTKYWPEFGQAGKEQVTVRQLVSHFAGIPFIDHAKPGDAFNWEKMVAAIAQQAPEWPPGTVGAYHTFSILFIFTKLIQAVTGENPWDWYRREITGAFGIDYHLRLTEADFARFGPDFETTAFLASAPISPEKFGRLFGGLGDPATLVEGGAGDATTLVTAGSARGVARAMAFLAQDGELDGTRLLSARTIDLIATQQWFEKCAVWGIPFRVGLGLMLNEPSSFNIGPNPKAFGAAGAGGNFGLADRENRIAMAYSLNRWWPALTLGDRAKVLVDAAYASI